MVWSIQISKLHFVLYFDKDLDGWKRKYKYEMSNGVEDYHYTYPLA